MSLLLLAEARALVGSGLGDPDLQAVIDREEAWLARRIGALSGSRVETFWPQPVDRDDPLRLRRPTASVAVTDGGVVLAGSAVRLLGDGTLAEKATGAWTGPSVAIVSTPTDTLEVKSGIVKLIRLTTTASPYDSETLGDYSYSRGGASEASQQQAIVRDLLPHGGPGTIRLRPADESQRIGAVAS